MAPRVGWLDDAPSLRPLAERVAKAQDGLENLLNPRNGKSMLNLNGMRRAQTAADAAKTAEQALTRELLSLLRHDRQHASADGEKLRQALQESEHSAREQRRENMRERETLQAESEKQAEKLTLKMNDALARMQTLETEVKEDFEYRLESIQRHHAEVTASLKRQHHDVCADLERQLNDERERAASAEQRLGLLYQQRLDAASEAAEATLRSVLSELPPLEGTVARLVRECGVLKGQQTDLQTAVRSHRAELQVATAAMSGEIDRLRKLIHDAMATNAATSTWRALQAEALKPSCQPPVALYQHSLDALAFLRRQEEGRPAEVPPPYAGPASHRSPPTNPQRPSSSPAPSPRASRVAAAAAAANRRVAATPATARASAPIDWKPWQGRAKGERLGGSRAWRERPREADLVASLLALSTPRVGLTQEREAQISSALKTL